MRVMVIKKKLNTEILNFSMRRQKKEKYKAKYSLSEDDLYEKFENYMSIE